MKTLLLYPTYNTFSFFEPQSFFKVMLLIAIIYYSYPFIKTFLEHNFFFIKMLSLFVHSQESWFHIAIFFGQPNPSRNEEIMLKQVHNLYHTYTAFCRFSLHFSEMKKKTLHMFMPIKRTE